MKSQSLFQTKTTPAPSPFLYRRGAAALHHLCGIAVEMVSTAGFLFPFLCACIHRCILIFCNTGTDFSLM